MAASELFFPIRWIISSAILSAGCVTSRWGHAMQRHPYHAQADAPGYRPSRLRNCRSGPRCATTAMPDPLRARRSRRNGGRLLPLPRSSAGWQARLHQKPVCAPVVSSVPFSDQGGSIGKRHSKAAPRGLCKPSLIQILPSGLGISVFAHPLSMRCRLPIHFGLRYACLMSSRPSA